MVFTRRSVFGLLASAVLTPFVNAGIYKVCGADFSAQLNELRGADDNAVIRSLKDMKATLLSKEIAQRKNLALREASIRQWADAAIESADAGRYIDLTKLLPGEVMRDR